MRNVFCNTFYGRHLEGNIGSIFCVISTGTREAFLLVASRNQIISDDISSQPNVVHSIVRDGRNIVAVDFDSATDRVYWSDTTQDRIWSAHKNGSDRTVVSASLPNRCLSIKPACTHTHTAHHVNRRLLMKQLL